MKQISLLLLTVLLAIGTLGTADAAVLCSNPSGSVFLRADSCRANEHQLDIDDLGLSIPPPNIAYTQSRGSYQLDEHWSGIAEINVDAGSYVVHAYAKIDNLGPAPYVAVINCVILPGNDQGSLTLQAPSDSEQNNISSGTLSLTSVADLPSMDRIWIQCTNNVPVGTSTAMVSNVRLTAMRVASINVQE
jgi:hypothetical protein